jgi:hypothetical protein
MDKMIVRVDPAGAADAARRRAASAGFSALYFMDAMYWS